MPSLEHLIQHYMRFSDGLPVNLCYPVPPKPKPPLPLFSTIPKTSRIKSPLTSPNKDLNAINQSVDDISISSPPLSKLPPKRNMSIPTDDLMNTIGILDKSLSPTTTKATSATDTTRKSSKDKHNNDILNFRSLKLKSPRKNIIIDGMKSLTKSKNKTKKQENVNSIQRQPEEISQSLRNLSFSTDLKPAAGLATDSLYNVPTNNTAVVVAEINCNYINEPVDGQSSPLKPVIDHNDNSTRQIASPSEIEDYFTESDYFAAKDKGAEEIYFIDAPTIQTSDALHSSSSSSATATIGYTAFKHIPYFPDGTQIPQDNNNHLAIQQNSRFTRLDSTNSLTSTDSERFFRQQSSIDASTLPSSPTATTVNAENRLAISKPNYFIPKSDLELKDILGEGEFGSVYRGAFKNSKAVNSIGADEIQVAIKTLHDEHCKQNRAEFLREASVMIKLSHHCIVKLIGISKVNFYFFKYIVKYILYTTWFQALHFTG